MDYDAPEIQGSFGGEPWSLSFRKTGTDSSR